MTGQVILRRLATVGLLGGLIAMLAGPTPVAAHTQTGVIVFTADADITTGSGDGKIYSPVSLACPGLVCSGGSYTYSLDTGFGSPRMCAGVIRDSGTVTLGIITDAVTVPDCELRSNGVVEPALHGGLPPGLGAYCGVSSGSGVVNGAIGVLALHDSLEVVWLASAGTLLPLLLTVDDVVSPSRPHANPGDPLRHPGKRAVGGGVAQALGVQPGTCGLDPRNGFDGTDNFAVTGFVTWHAI